MKRLLEHTNESRGLDLALQSKEIRKTNLGLRTMKLFFGLALLATFFTSCYTEVIVEDPYIETAPNITLNQLLNSQELWYIDVDRTSGSGSVHFLQTAFTISFRNGVLMANNNLVGFGDQGNGFGIPIGNYGTFDYLLDVDHDIDGLYTFEVTQLSSHEIELYFPHQNVRYVLEGYQRSNFDYNGIFYRNIHYFLQEYITWEKVYTSEFGALNDFDNENFVAFLPGGGDGNFRSSQDAQGTNIYNIYWDYEGIYNVDDAPGDQYLKYLTLDYDFFGGEYFDLTVLDDHTIEFLHVDSGTVYQFKGRGYIEFKKPGEGKLRKSKAEIAKTMKKISKF